MNESIRHQVPIRLLIFLLGYAVTLLVFGLVLSSVFFADHPHILAGAMLFDLVLTLPVVYWFLIRNTQIPTITIVPVCLIGFLFAGFTFPENQQLLVSTVRNGMVPLIELGVILFLVGVVRQTASDFADDESYDRKVRIENATEKMFGKNRLAKLAATEFTMLYYLLRWPQRNGVSIRRLETPKGATVFSYHRNSGMAAIWMALIGVVFVEITVIHILLARWSHLAAWIASLSSVYVAMMIVAQIRATRCRPIFIHDEHLHIYNGMVRLARIPLNSIASVEASTKEPPSAPNHDSTIPVPLRVCVPVTHNVVLKIKHTISAELMYGAKRDFQIALLRVDEPRELVRMLQEQIQPN